MLSVEKSVDGSRFIFLYGKSKNQKCTAAGEVIECAGGLLIIGRKNRVFLSPKMWTFRAKSCFVAKNVDF